MDQDWKPIILNPKGRKSKTPKDPLMGGVVVKKNVSNKRKPADNLSKISRAEEAERIPPMNKNLCIKIQQARNAKNLTQSELAVKINEPKSIIALYESGGAIVDYRIIDKMERVLGPLR